MHAGCAEQKGLSLEREWDAFLPARFLGPNTWKVGGMLVASIFFWAFTSWKSIGKELCTHIRGTNYNNNLGIVWRAFHIGVFGTTLLVTRVSGGCPRRSSSMWIMSPLTPRPLVQNLTHELLVGATCFLEKKNTIRKLESTS